MESAASIETVTLRIPHSDSRFLSALAKKLGWTIEGLCRAGSKKTGLDVALEDVRKGGLKSFQSIESLREYLYS